MGSLTYDFNNERILDVVVDGNNNYYFLAEVGGHNFTLDTMNFETYNYHPNRKDIFVFSTDEEGNYRWSKNIGGGTYDHANSIGLDDQNNVYVSGLCWNFLPPVQPVHFDADTIMNPGTLEPGPNNKTMFIIKYDYDGNFQWLRQPENDETPQAGSGAILQMIVEPDGTTHSLIALIAGTYFDGELTIPPMDTIGNQTPLQTMIIQYNSDGDFQGYTLIDMKPILGFYDFQFAYDPVLDRYYIGDTRRGNSTANPLSINGHGAETINKGFYLAAVSSEGEVIWYHENQLFGAYHLGDLTIDDNGDIYLAGAASAPDNFAGYIFDQEGSGSGSKSPFLLKLNSDGTLIWGTNAEYYSPWPGHSIVIKDDNVYLGLGMLNNVWENLEIPAGGFGIGLASDIQILRFDSQTGVAQHVIQNTEVHTPGRDAIMAMALDNNGDLVVGGYFSSHLFYGTDFHIQNTGQDSDFFMAKYQLPDTIVGVSEHAVPTQIRAYPNPTTGGLTLQSPIPLSTYTLTDLQGRLVGAGHVVDNQIDMSHAERGVYILQVRGTQGEIGNVKVVKE